MNVIEKRQKEIVHQFSEIENWESRYEKIIAFGKELPDLPQEKKIDQFLVKGCQSKVWLHARIENEKVVFEADSDAVIVRGLIALLLRVYSQATPDDILSTKPDFIAELGFKKNLSVSRSNGLLSMIKQIHHYATAFKVMLSQNR